MCLKPSCSYFCFNFQGGFAKCYELTDADTKEIFAGKIVPKSLLVKQHQKDKVCFLFWWFFGSVCLGNFHKRYMQKWIQVLIAIEISQTEDLSSWKGKECCFFHLKTLITIICRVYFYAYRWPRRSAFTAVYPTNISLSFTPSLRTWTMFTSFWNSVVDG